MRLADYKPTPYQQAFHASTEPYRALVGGVGQGKTTAALVEAVRYALDHPGATVLLARSHFRDLYCALWHRLPQLCEGLPVEFVQTRALDLTAHFANGSRIFGRHIPPYVEPSWLQAWSLDAGFVEHPSECHPEALSRLYPRLRGPKGPPKLWVTAAEVELLPPHRYPFAFTEFPSEVRENPRLPAETVT